MNTGIVLQTIINLLFIYQIHLLRKRTNERFDIVADYMEYQSKV